MTRTEFLEALDAYVETLVGLREPELRQANATLRTKLERAEAEIERLRKQIDGIVDDEVRRAKLASTRQGTDTVTLAEVLRVVRVVPCVAYLSGDRDCGTLTTCRALRSGERVRLWGNGLPIFHTTVPELPTLDADGWQLAPRNRTEETP